MNREKIVKELNEWVQSEFGSFYYIKNDGDLTLMVNDDSIAWFGKFKMDKFYFESSYNCHLGITLIKKDIIKKFYDKAVEVLSSDEEPRYTIRITSDINNYLLANKCTKYMDVVFDSLFDSSVWESAFTKSQIEEFKKRDDLAIDWDKAIIEEVSE